MPWLQCEGECNPERAMLDEAVRMERSGFRAFGPLYDDWLLTRLRQLKYTGHYMATPHQAVCSKCGKPRRWGAA
jgi:hypothetical protein